MNTKFRNNLYFNISPHRSDTRPLIGNPRFVRPGRAGADIDLKTMSDLRGYRLKPYSPALKSGVVIRGSGKWDLLKTRGPVGRPSVGAFEVGP